MQKVPDQKLAKLLLEKNLIKEKTLISLLAQAKSEEKSLANFLLEREVIADEKLGQVLAEMYDVPFVKLSEKNIPDPLFRIIPYNLAAHKFVIPFEQNANELFVALNNPHNYELIAFIEKKIGLSIIPYYATKKDIKNALKGYNRNVHKKFTKLLKGALADQTKIESLKDAAKILDTIILFAYQNNASDIHIEPHKNFLSVRYRIDGILQTITELPLAILDLLTTRIKVLANLRTDEHMAAQDGRFKIDLESNEITMRVSVLPTYDGEKTVLRILSSANQELNIEALGYSEHDIKIIKNNIAKTHGILLITGPTGSGKTTTLYSLLKLVNSPEINISTIEDPVEYRLEGINQIQVNSKTNLTFAMGLRSLLRQDPDVIMVGEIRDKETAGIAINAALTGHLVLATLHTNDVPSTLPRLIDMGIEPFLISSTVKMVLAQRLIRKICTKCKQAFQLDIGQIGSLGEKFHLNIDLKEVISKLMPSETITFYKGAGCAACGGNGLKGRTCIAEVMNASERISRIILENKSPKEIETVAKEEGMTPMFIDGLEKVLKGITTIEEVLRVMRS